MLQIRLQIRLRIRLRSVCEYNSLLVNARAATTLIQIREGSLRERPNAYTPLRVPPAPRIGAGRVPVRSFSQRVIFYVPARTLAL